MWRTQVELEILKQITFDVRLGFTALPQAVALAQAAALQPSKSKQPVRKRRRCSPFNFQPTVWRTQVELEILKQITFDVRSGFTALPLAQAVALQPIKSKQPVPAPLQLPAHSVAHTNRARDTEIDFF